MQQRVPEVGSIVSLFGTGRIGKLVMVPIGMVIGEGVENAETTCKYTATEMTEMLRTGMLSFRVY